MTKSCRARSRRKHSATAAAAPGGTRARPITASPGAVVRVVRTHLTKLSEQHEAVAAVADTATALEKEIEEYRERAEAAEGEAGAVRDELRAHKLQLRTYKLHASNTKSTLVKKFHDVKRRWGSAAAARNRRANAAALSLEDAIAEYNDEVTDAAEKLSKQVRSVPVRAPCAPVITAGAPRLRRISTTASRR